jgi:phosphatidylserine decarboxylase
MTNEALEKTLFDLKETISQTLMTPTNKAGWPFIIGFAVVSVILGMISSVLGFAGLVLTLWCLYFFRDPVRMVPTAPGLVVSPADGRVTDVAEGVPLPKELRADPMDGNDEDGDYTRISIFLSVFDVHVNRIPTAGTLKKIVYRPGLFLNAGNERASIENERCAALLDLPNGRELAFVQIAGLIARRIICDAKEGDVVNTGERYGLIRFGSRMDIYLPQGVTAQVAVGQRAVGGETILADLNGTTKQREAKAV